MPIPGLTGQGKSSRTQSHTHLPWHRTPRTPRGSLSTHTQVFPPLGPRLSTPTHTFTCTPAHTLSHLLTAHSRHAHHTQQPGALRPAWLLSGSRTVQLPPQPPPKPGDTLPVSPAGFPRAPGLAPSPARLRGAQEPGQKGRGGVGKALPQPVRPPKPWNALTAAAQPNPDSSPVGPAELLEQGSQGRLGWGTRIWGARWPNGPRSPGQG